MIRADSSPLGAAAVFRQKQSSHTLGRLPLKVTFVTPHTVIFAQAAHNVGHGDPHALVLHIPRPITHITVVKVHHHPPLPTSSSPQNLPTHHYHHPANQMCLSRANGNAPPCFALVISLENIFFASTLNSSNNVSRC